MHRATSKYFGEQGDQYGGILHWPGANGIPFRGDAVPNLKKREMAQLPIVASAHHQVFDLSDQEQSATYSWIRDRIKNGLFVCDYVERWRDGNNMWVYLEWSQLYTQMPKTSKSLGSHGNGNPNQFTLRSSD